MMNNKRENLAFDVISLYQAGSILFLFLAFLFSIGIAKELSGPFLAGPLIAWAHFFTLGVIAPSFFGYSFYALLESYSAQGPSRKAVVFQFALHYLSLSAFLWNIVNREGGLPLLLSAIGLFVAAMIFLKLFLGPLVSRFKEFRGRFEFWVDLVSGFYIFQTVLFGLVLAINLFHPILVSSLYHSLKLHSHSGIVGFFFLQWVNHFRRQMLRKSPAGFTEKPLFAWVAFIAVAVSLCLWTSVHDKFEPFFHLFFAGASIGVISLLIYIFQNRFYRVDGFGLFWAPLLFLLAGVVTGSDLIYSPNREYLEEHSLYFLYALYLFFGFFALSNVGFLYDVVSLYFSEKVDALALSGLSKRVAFVGAAALLLTALIWVGNPLWIRLALGLILVLLLNLYSRFYSIYRPYMRREL